MMVFWITMSCVLVSALVVVLLLLYLNNESCEFSWHDVGILTTTNPFGYALGMNAAGDKLVVSNKSENSVYFYDYRDTQWSLSTSADATDGVYGTVIAMDQTGSWVAVTGGLDGDHIGYVKVYEDGEAKGSTLQGTADGEYFGYGLDITSDNGDVYLAVGSPLADTPFVTVYKLSGSDFATHCQITSSASADRFGRNVSIKCVDSKVYLAVSATIGDYFSVYDVTVESSPELLVSQTNTPVSSIVLSGDMSRIAIGNIADDLVSVYEFGDNYSTLSQIGESISGLSDTETEYLGIGIALSFDGSVLALGASRFPSSTEEDGYGEVYDYVSGSWQLRGGRTFNLRNSEDDSLFGKQVSLSSDGSRVVFGAHGAGKVFTYDWS
jgi:hypothetical protein